jgi:hypothetical protein
VWSTKVKGNQKNNICAKWKYRNYKKPNGNFRAKITVFEKKTLVECVNRFKLAEKIISEHEVR